MATLWEHSVFKVTEFIRGRVRIQADACVISNFSPQGRTSRARDWVCLMWALQLSTTPCHAKEALTFAQEDSRKGTSRLLCSLKFFLAPILAAGILGSSDRFTLPKGSQNPWGTKQTDSKAQTEEGSRSGVNT